MSSATKNQLAFIFKKLGEYDRRKDWFNFCCPFHGGSRKNLGVNVRAGVYKCLGCSAEGGLVGLYARLRRGHGDTSGWGKGLLVPAEVDEVLSGTSEPVTEVSEAIDHEANTESFLKKYHPIGSSQSISMISAGKYLTKREVDPRRWDVGLHDDLPGRVVFPFVENGLVKYYMGRSFENIPLKTVNPDSSQGWLHKSDILFNFDGIKGHTHVILCEGIFDAISTQEKLGKRATCLLGKTISEKQIRLLGRAGVQQVTVFLDSDARIDSTSLALKLYYSGFRVNLMEWHHVSAKEGKDPGEIAQAPMRLMFERALSISPELEFQLLAESL